MLEKAYRCAVSYCWFHRCNNCFVISVIPPWLASDNNSRFDTKPSVAPSYIVDSIVIIALRSLALAVITPWLASDNSFRFTIKPTVAPSRIVDSIVVIALWSLAVSVITPWLASDNSFRFTTDQAYRCVVCYCWSHCCNCVVAERPSRRGGHYRRLLQQGHFEESIKTTICNSLKSFIVLMVRNFLESIKKWLWILYSTSTVVTPVSGYRSSPVIAQLRRTATALFPAMTPLQTAYCFMAPGSGLSGSFNVHFFRHCGQFLSYSVFDTSADGLWYSSFKLRIY